MRVPGKSAALQAGTVYGRLTVLEFAEKRGWHYYYKCRCSCGNEKVIVGDNLVYGHAKSCGCLQAEVRGQANRTHGETRTRLYNVWAGMKSRCFDTNNPAYKSYGGRGITVCMEWADSYETFRDWARTHGYRDDLTLERIDVDGNYEPSNCTFVPRYQQCLNKRNTLRMTAFGETKLLKEWVKDPRCVVKYHTLFNRVKVGWSSEYALTTPPAANHPTLRPR